MHEITSHYKRPIRRVLFIIRHLIFKKQNMGKRYFLSTEFKDTLIRCHCSHFEMEMIKAVSNVSVYLNKQITEAYKTVLTVSFDVFQYICEHKTFPGAFIKLENA